MGLMVELSAAKAWPATSPNNANSMTKTLRHYSGIGSLRLTVLPSQMASSVFLS